MDEQKDPRLFEQKDRIKLSKMSKGYQWEISINFDPELSDEDAMKRLDWLNSELQKKYGNVIEGS